MTEYWKVGRSRFALTRRPLKLDSGLILKKDQVVKIYAIYHADINIYCNREMTVINSTLKSGTEFYIEARMLDLEYYFDYENFNESELSLLDALYN